MMFTAQRLVLKIAALSMAVAPAISGATPETLEDRLNALEAQNRQLREELATQKKTIQELESRFGSRTLEVDPEPIATEGFSFGRLHVSGEGGVAFFHTGADGLYPENPFRVDEAKLFLEAPLWESTYIFSELDLVTREANDEFFHLGELYVEFENVLRHWTDENFLSLRIGRVDIPFGEEYLVRDVIDNPLISRSLSDLWGIDEGVELYGEVLGFDYVVAVQNGGHPTLEDFDSDKSVAGRIGYNFGSRGRVSFSGIRTGNLSSEGDELSELWFGSGFFRNVGPTATTETFRANLFELDGQVFWNNGHFKAAGGYLDYEDSDTASDNARDGYYYYGELYQRLLPKVYAAGRFSQIIVNDGLPIVGYGDFGKYFFSPLLTDDLWRLSLGLGYQWNENLVTKVEYAIEEGSLTTGGERDNHFFGAELGFKF